MGILHLGWGWLNHDGGWLSSEPLYIRGEAVNVVLAEPAKARVTPRLDLQLRLIAVFSN